MKEENLQIITNLAILEKGFSGLDEIIANKSIQISYFSLITRELIFIDNDLIFTSDKNTSYSTVFFSLKNLYPNISTYFIKDFFDSLTMHKTKFLKIICGMDYDNRKTFDDLNITNLLDFIQILMADKANIPDKIMILLESLFPNKAEIKTSSCPSCENISDSKCEC